MTLAVDMRPGASPHIGLWQNGNCNVTTCLVCMRTCHLSYIGIVSVGHWLNLWRNHTTLLISGKCYPTTYGYAFQLPKHTSARCSSWSYDLIYNIVRVWPDLYQERNALIPLLHEYDNLGDSWQSLPCTFIRKSSFCQREHMDLSWM